VGDPEKPKMVFFFDEAHLLFRNASKSLLEKIEQVVKLIRSKGVSIFFVTQSPGDIPGAVMSQLGNKIEHGLHAYTPAERRALDAAADAFRENPEFDTKELMQNLGTGEAVVSMLDEKGAPSVAEYAFILPPESRMGALTEEERRNAVDYSPLNNKYLVMVDNVSAYEVITGRVPGAAASGAGSVTAPDGQVYGNTSGIPAAEPAAQTAADEAITIDYDPVPEPVKQPKVKPAAKAEDEGGSVIGDLADNYLGKAGTRQVIRSTGSTIGREIGKTIGEAVLGKKGRTIGGNIGSAIGRNLLGTLTGKR
jgi:hypothetical protein